MMNIANQPHKIFNTAQKAQLVADALASDDDWNYRVNVDPKGSGRAFIEIFDKDGELVGRVS